MLDRATTLCEALERAMGTQLRSEENRTLLGSMTVWEYASRHYGTRYATLPGWSASVYELADLTIKYNQPAVDQLIATYGRAPRTSPRAEELDHLKVAAALMSQGTKPASRPAHRDVVRLSEGDVADWAQRIMGPKGLRQVTEAGQDVAAEDQGTEDWARRIMGDALRETGARS